MVRRSATRTPVEAIFGVFLPSQPPLIVTFRVINSPLEALLRALAPHLARDPARAFVGVNGPHGNALK